MHTLKRVEAQTPVGYDKAAVQAAQSSGLGIVGRLMGVTLPVEAAREICTLPVESTILEYTSVLYASSDASEKQWNLM